MELERRPSRGRRGLAPSEAVESMSSGLCEVVGEDEDEVEGPSELGERRRLLTRLKGTKGVPEGVRSVAVLDQTSPALA